MFLWTIKKWGFIQLPNIQEKVKVGVANSGPSSSQLVHLQAQVSKVHIA